jgi:hypothetical protein
VPSGPIEDIPAPFTAFIPAPAYPSGVPTAVIVPGGTIAALDTATNKNPRINRKIRFFILHAFHKEK